MLKHEPVTQKRIRLRGIVQGVGMRPDVWRRATALGLCGQVRNDDQGVLIECRGPEQKIAALVAQLREAPPPLASISTIECQPCVETIENEGFCIVDSRQNTAATTAISPDIATCPACLAEICDPANRRFGYAFTNCTHCGPRLSILRDLPYDRANTSMAVFRQCTACLAEYENPADRRFHAQPNACPACGPQLWLQDVGGQRFAGDPLDCARAALRRGDVVAIKGIGGFQLVVDATNAKAVARLRQRKQRPHKPFALMARDLAMVERYCRVDVDEACALQSAQAPIVLLSRLLSRRESAGGDLAGVADDQVALGFMLPTTPLHHLLLRGLAGPVVMTSGNASGRPQCIANDQALADLKDIADVFLMHDRDVVQRVDDSVLRLVGGQVHMLRRARGYAPAPMALPPGFLPCPPILAFGGDLKNSFCLLRGDHAVLSQHIGDLRDALTLHDYERSVALFRRAHQHRADTVVLDQHPQYLSSQLARQLAEDENLTAVEVQHHHAHIAACLGDNAYPLQAPPVLAVALDGMGYAEGEIWGGEIFLADYRHARRLACLKPVPLPGGNAAMREPWRNLVAQLHAAKGWSRVVKQYGDLAPIAELAHQPVTTVLAMIERGLNAPLSSSCGRLFDAVAAALGLCSDSITYEGQAAMMLEASITEVDWAQAMPYPFARHLLDGLHEIDPAPMWRALLADLRRGETHSVIAARFHLGLAEALCDTLRPLAAQRDCRTVALTGGVMQNAHLQKALCERLKAANLHVLVHRDVPANDGGIALGQALIAAARMKTETTACA